MPIIVHYKMNGSEESIEAKNKDEASIFIRGIEATEGCEFVYGAYGIRDGKLSKEDILSSTEDDVDTISERIGDLYPVDIR